MKTTHRSSLEILEARIAPASLDVSGGLLTYTAGAGVGNSVTLSIVGANYSINDSQETITLTSAAVGAGFTSVNANTILAPNAGVSFLNFALGDLADQFQVTGLSDPLTVDGGAGAGDTAFVTGAINPGGALAITAEGITVSQAVSGATTVDFTADTMAINAGVTASGRVVLVPQTAARPISLGLEVAGSLSLTDAELDRFTTPGVLQVGGAASGALNIDGAVSVTNAGTLSLVANGSIGQSAAISVANLAARTTGVSGIQLVNAGNDVGTFAASTAASLTFVDVDDLVIGTVDGVAGLAASSQLNLPLGIMAGATTQSAGAGIVTSSLQLLGTGPYTLNDAANDVDSITGTVAGAFSFTDADDLTVTGLSTTNSAVSLTTLDGDLTLSFVGGSSGIGAGTGAVSLTAGGDGLLTIQSGAGVLGTGGVTFTADNMSIGGTVNAGAGIATLRPFESGTQVELGGQDGGNTLGLMDAELDFVTAGVLRVGSATAGALTISGPVNAAGTGTLSLISGGSVTRSGTGSLTETNLRVSAAGGMNLNSIQNDVGTLAAAGEFVLFVNGSKPLTIGTVDGVSGVTTGDDVINIVSGAIEIGQPLDSGTARTSLGPLVGTPVNLGTTDTGYALSDDELDLITAAEVAISASAAAINVNSPLSPAGTGRLRLEAESLAGAGSIAVANLALVSSGNVAINGANDVDTLAVSLGAGGSSFAFADADGFTIGTVGGVAGFATSGISLATVNAGAGTVAFASGATFRVDIQGATPGTEHDQLAITGVVNLGGATLAGSATVVPGTEVILISNDGTDPVVGTFAGLVGGGFISIGGFGFRISYTGGDGNDVALTPAVSDFAIGSDKRSATYTDVDGDLVTLTVSKGKLSAGDFTLAVAGALGGSQLQRVNFADDGGEFRNANLTIKAVTPAGGAGDGLVNVGAIDSIGFDLGKVKISGDLGQIDAGDDDARKPGLLKLKLGSLGAFGPTTQDNTGNLGSEILGDLTKLAVSGSIKNAVLNITGKLTAGTVGGDLEGTGGTSAGLITVSKAIGTLAIGGSVKGGATFSGISSGRTIGALTIGGDLFTTDPARPVVISAFGSKNAVASGGIDLAIGTLTIGGVVDHARILAGHDFFGNRFNADASIGTLTVGESWTASTALAGTEAGPDGFEGTADDILLDNTGVRNVGGVHSQIAKIVIAGQAFGTIAPTTDSFGIIAERIVKAKVNGVALAFTATAGEAFSPTLTGPGQGGAPFDFSIREIIA